MTSGRSALARLALALLAAGCGGTARTHDWPYWRRDLRETLPDLARVLARA